MKLIDKIQLACALPAAFLIVVSLWSIWGFDKMYSKVGTIYDDRIVPLKQLKDISDDYGLNIIDAVNKAHAKTMSINEAINSIETAQKSIRQTWNDYTATYLTQEEKILATQTEKLFDPTNEEIDKVLEALKTGNVESLDQYDGELYEYIDPLTNKIQELIDLQLNVAQNEREKAKGVFLLLTVGLGVLSIVTLLIVLLPLRIFVSRLVIFTVRDTVNTLAATSNQIATAADEQERLTEKQADSVNKTSTTMNELRMSATESAQQAESAAVGAQQVLNLSAQGGKAVNQTLLGMSQLKEKVNDVALATAQLNEQLSQIDSYQKIVAEIADQTNMLALNAAIEAVNAGKEGKGFMVVANEIRKLSEQSKESADRINASVANIQNALKTTLKATAEGTRTVELEVSMAQSTAETFENVVNAINEVVVNVQQISLNVKQQASAVQHVVDEMSTLNQAAMETACGIRQTKEGTHKLAQKAQELQAMV